MPLSDVGYKALANSIIFQSFPDDELRRMAAELSETVFPRGTVLLEYQELPEKVYIIASGTVKVSRDTVDGDEAVLGYLSAGNFIGELGLIGDQRRSARVVCETDATVVVFNKENFEKLVLHNSRATLNLLRELGNRIRLANDNIVHQLENQRRAIENRFNKLQRLIESSKVFNSTLDLGELLGLILHAATSGTAADRGTVYLLDALKGELWSKVLQGENLTEIRLPLGSGIAGYVAQTGETINIPDAYADKRFNPETDKRSGYRTHNMLCMPMRNKQNDIIGVFQLLNKPGGPFDDTDVQFIEALSGYSSVSIENARLAQEMVQSERLSAVGKMASTIIHDIKNPMSTIRVYAQMMKRKSGNEEAAKLADEMIQQIDRFVNMTQEILDFSRGVSATNFQDVQFEQVMESVLNFIETDLTKHKVVLKRETAFAGMVSIDQDKLTRVFYNLASNARDAMHDGGTLTVKTFADGASVVVEFIDTGSGMPEEVKKKIFEPFVTYGKKHGTGLGMAIVKKVIDDHKGSIAIESELGKGTLIRIALPCA